MRMGLLGSVLLCLAGAGGVQAQPGDAACGPGGCPDAATAFGGDVIADNAFSSEPCCPTYCTWGSLDFLYYFLRDGPLPPLLTTSVPPTPEFQTTSGILGNPNTRVIFGHEPVGLKDVMGGRVTAGFWMDSGQHFGAEASYFELEQVRNRVAEDSDPAGRPVLSRPVINAQTGEETVLFTSFPDQIVGAVGVTYQTRLYGAEANLVVSPWSCYFDFVDYLIGFRYLNLDEELGIAQNSSLLQSGRAAFNGAVIAAPASLAVTDRFTATNQFMGGQFGIRKTLDCGLAYLRLQAKVAIGSNRQTVEIDGGTLFGNGQQVQFLPGGLLALGSNIGGYRNNEISVVPDGEVTLGFRVTKYLNVHVGYNILYWTQTTRPGNLIDRQVNPALLPTSLQFGSGAGPARPALDNFDQGNFWAHGVNVGIGFEY